MDDAEKVCNKIQEHHANWKKIGEALGINSDKLNDIDRKHKSTEHCLAKLVRCWLCGPTPRPTHTALSIALYVSSDEGRDYSFVRYQLLHVVHLVCVQILLSR